MAVENDELGYYDECHPSYTIPNGIEGLFSGIGTNYTEGYTDFYRACTDDIAAYSQSRTYAPKANQPCNTFYVSCMPNISFAALSLDLYQGAACFTPMITIGKLIGQRNENIRFHASSPCRMGRQPCRSIYATLQKLADTAEQWMNER